MTPRKDETWEQMYARHQRIAQRIHDLAGDEDPHTFGRGTASCDWLADNLGIEGEVGEARPFRRPSLMVDFP